MNTRSLSVVFLLLLSPNLFAEVAQISPQELAKDSDLIVIGKVGNIEVTNETAKEPEREVPVKYATIYVKEILKGKCTSTVIVKYAYNKNMEADVQDPNMEEEWKVLLYLKSNNDTRNSYSVVDGWSGVGRFHEGKFYHQYLERNFDEYVEQLKGFIKSESPLAYVNDELIAAVKNNDIQKVNELISKGADVNAINNTGRTPLMCGGKTETAKLLINNGADVNAKDLYDMTPLIYTIRRGDSEKAILLINSGADVNAKDSGGMTPLLEAAMKGLTETAKLLIDKGADVNSRDNSDMTPLIYATMFINPEIAKLLIDKGANVNAKGMNGCTPLMFLWPNDTETAKLLIDNGADVNARDNTGMTPLIYAAMNGLTETAKLLIDKGADVNAKDSDGKTALSLAESKGHGDIVKLLRAAGAK